MLAVHSDCVMSGGESLTDMGLKCSVRMLEAIIVMLFGHLFEGQVEYLSSKIWSTYVIRVVPVCYFAEKILERLSN
jgi:hypothetical protein